MAFTFVNSTLNTDEHLFADFIAKADSAMRQHLHGASFDEATAARFIFNALSHVKSPVYAATIPLTPGIEAVLEGAVRYLGACPAPERGKKDCDLVLASGSASASVGFERVRPNGWLLLPPAATKPEVFPSGFTLEATLFGWAIYRRDVTPADYEGRIHIIVPTYNHCDLLRECMAHVDRQSVSHLIHCIVIDDGSTDGVAEMMADSYPHMTVLTGDGSLWWGGAINMGLDHVRQIMAPEDFVVFLNNDVMMDITTIEELLLLALKDRATCWATAAVTRENAVASGERGHALYRFEWMLDLLSRHQQSVEVAYLFGRTTIMPVELFAVVPGIDTTLFQHYWSDSDFSLRAKAAGYATAITGRTYVRLHHDPDTTGTHIDFFDRGRSWREVWNYFTDIKSLGNLKFAWRFHARHNRSARKRLLWTIIRKGLQNHKWLRSTPRKGAV
ncbi:glycosyltransferase family 2 protein [Kordiimonas aestuarii]|uniref:glycosyltransferase family 2 protein n=1 Tax=Kordiimonas aestuarii TaxID=1005925 RepID=UPI0021CFFC1E|nr:glycosyltransferase [Kordiimonas aestuarii]